MAKKELPEINASSLADIAFLLLTFFLIATSMDKREGLIAKIPDPRQEVIPQPKQPQNVLELVLSTQKTEVLVEGERQQPQYIKDFVKLHVLNNLDGSCTYCVGGQRNPKYSNNPDEALVMIKTLKATPHDLYITVRNEIDKAYNEIWNEYAQRTYNTSLDNLREIELKSEDENEKADAAAKIEEITQNKFKKRIGVAAPEN